MMTKKIHIQAKINGKDTEFLCEPRQSLLEVLRDELRLTGTKEGCNNGNCGACNVILDGRLVNACLVMRAEVQGKSVTTMEGVASMDGLHPIQQCFLEGAALQCGICTPGFIVAAKALLDKNPHPTEHEIRFWLAGNLCRCTGYDKIVRAVQEAAHRVQGSGFRGQQELMVDGSEQFGTQNSELRTRNSELGTPAEPLT